MVIKGKTIKPGLPARQKRYRNNVPVLQRKVQLYRNRAMADGRFYQELTGRGYVQQGEYLIILPADVTVTAAEQQALLEIAEQLYQ